MPPFQKKLKNLFKRSSVIWAAGSDISLSPTGEFVDLGKLTVSGIISAFVKVTLIVAALVFFFVLVIGGIRWILSGGDKAQTETARGQITAALIGLVIVFSAWAIIQLLHIFFGVDIVSLQIPSAL